MKIYSYIYYLRTFQNNQVTTMISYVIFIYSGNFQRFLNNSTYFQKLLKASICMEKNSREFWTFPETFMTIHEGLDGGSGIHYSLKI